MRFGLLSGSTRDRARACRLGRPASRAGVFLVHRRAPASLGRSSGVRSLTHRRQEGGTRALELDRQWEPPGSRHGSDSLAGRATRLRWPAVASVPGYRAPAGSIADLPKPVPPWIASIDPCSADVRARNAETVDDVMHGCYEAAWLIGLRCSRWRAGSEPCRVVPPCWTSTATPRREMPLTGAPTSWLACPGVGSATGNSELTRAARSTEPAPSERTPLQV